MEIILEEVSKEINKKSIFSNINWTISNHSFVAIKGNSGAGKTSLLNIISLLEKPSSGNILFDTVNVTNSSIRKRRMYLRKNLGFIFQNYGLLEHSSIRENLELGLKSRKLSKKQKVDLMMDAMEQMNLSKLDLNEKISSLSGGEHQRIGVARCILKQGTTIIADEPTAALDWENEKMIMLKLKQLNAIGYTIILTTHSKRYDEWFDDIFYI